MKIANTQKKFPSAYRLLVDGEFQKDLHEKLASARKRIYVQTLAFDGDAAGLPVAKKLKEAALRGVEVKVLIDCHTDVIVSDTYHRRKIVANEARSTKEMIQRLRRNGVRVRRTRPFGPLNIFFLNRNHKNIFVVDDSCYIGGTRLTDHNFAWHDFMVRIADPTLVEAAADDFLHSFRGKERAYAGQNGIVTNANIRRMFYRLLGGAKKEIIISSPYLFDLHLLRSLRYVRPGVRIRILTSQRSNLGIINWIAPYISECLRKRKIELLHYTRFSHAKFIILDKEKVFFGSSNFGLESFLCKEEIGIYVDDPMFGNEFYQRLFVQQRHILRPHASRPSRRQYVKGFFLSYVMHYTLLAYGKIFHPVAPRLKRT